MVRINQFTVHLIPIKVCLLNSFSMCEQVCSLRHGKVEHQRVLQLTLLTSALLPVDFVLKLDTLFTI